MCSDRSRKAVLGALFALALVGAPPVGAQDLPEGSHEAILEFAEGMRLYMAGDGAQAMQHFLAAHELDPDFAVALFFAGIQAVNQGDRARADSLYALAEAHGDRLSSYYRARIRSSRASAMGDMQAALAEARRAADAAPGSKGVYNYALYSLRMNRPAEALRALESLDPDRHPFLEGYSAFWNQLQWARHETGRHEDELAGVQEWSRRFGAPLHLAHVMALAALGRVDEADRHVQAATAEGAGWSQPFFMATSWSELEAHGHDVAARRIRGEWLQQNASLADEGSMGDRFWYGWALVGEGRDDEARRVFMELAETEPEDIAVRAMAGIASARAGDRDGAAAAARWLDERSGRSPPTGARAWRGLLDAAGGDGDASVEHLRQAMSGGVYKSIWWHRDPVMIALRDHMGVQAFFRGDG